jgi:pimeloyl-ACP methyl ester carboxylesterase
MKKEHRRSLEAVLFYIHTIYSDLIGFNARRNALLRQFWVTQKTIARKEREMSYLQVENRESLAPALMIHGSPGNAMDWEKFLHKPDLFSIWAVDRPGYGPTPQKKPDLESDIEMLGDLLGNIHTEKKPILVGHSLGAGLAARLAIEYQDNVAGLILVSPALDPEDKGTQNLFVGIFQFICGLLFSRSIRHSGKELDQYKKFLRNLSERCSEITCPVYMIHSRDDRFVDAKNLDYGKNLFVGSSDVKAIILDKGGHFLNKRRPDVINKAMRELVKAA